MTTLVNPLLFSQRFPVTLIDLDNAGLIDPILNSDTKLFVDPLLLSSSALPRISNDAFKLLNGRFEEIIRLVDASGAIGDKAWRSAAQRLDLRERPETGLGYGGG